VFSTSPGTDQVVIDPGPIGFIAIAVVAVGAILLTLDMVRRIRRTRIRAEVTAMLDAEAAAATKGTSAP
jgi:hypothetical protein